MVEDEANGGKFECETPRVGAFGREGEEPRPAARIIAAVAHARPPPPSSGHIWEEGRGAAAARRRRIRRRPAPAVPAPPGERRGEESQ